MTDLIERLRDPKERVYPDDLMDEAADRIERLDKDVNGLMELLRKDRQRIERLEEIVGEVIAGRYDDALLLTANLEGIDEN